MNFAAITNALQVTGTAANPRCISRRACVPYNIFQDGGVTQDAARLSVSQRHGLRHHHAAHDACATSPRELGDYHINIAAGPTDGSRSTSASNIATKRWSSRPMRVQTSGLLSGFGGAAVAIDNGYSVRRRVRRAARAAGAGRPGIKDLVFDTGFRRSDYYDGRRGQHAQVRAAVRADSDDCRFRGFVSARHSRAEHHRAVQSACSWARSRSATTRARRQRT